MSEQLFTTSQLLTLINNLPKFAIDQQLQESPLSGILDDVIPGIDAHSIVGCNSLASLPQPVRAQMNIMHDLFSDAPHGAMPSTPAWYSPSAEPILADLVAQFRSNGFPVDAYHPPVPIHYHYNDAYLATLLLWRKHDKLPISANELAMVAALEQFILFTLTGITAWRLAKYPNAYAFPLALARIAEEHNINEHENRVAILLLHGCTYEQAGTRLFRGVDAVRRHVRGLYRKLNVHSVTELFARYFIAHEHPSAP